LIQKGFSAFFGICGANATAAFLKRPDRKRDVSIGSELRAVHQRVVNTPRRRSRPIQSPPANDATKIPFNFQLVCNPNNKFQSLIVFRKDRVFRKLNNRDHPELLSPKRINAGRLSDARAGQNLRGGSSSFQGVIAS
jgi:hypothetical protein